MAKISDSKPKGSSDGYLRAFGNPELATLISKIQGTVSSAGRELKRMILKRVKNKIENLDEFLKQEIMPNGVFIASKEKIKKCKTLDSSQAEPDFLIFKRQGGQQKCHVVELKDGHQFDNKRARAERDIIHSFVEQNGHKLPYIVEAHICCFNQADRASIVKGFKNEISLAEALTGKEFCQLLEIDYAEIVEKRKKDQPGNMEYFLKELVRIEPIKKTLKNLLAAEQG